MARIGIAIEVTEETTKQNDYSNLPNGTYKLEIIASDVPETGEGTPDHKLVVKTTVEVLEPAEYAGRRFFADYNLIHPSITRGERLTENIGKKQYSCLVRALNLSEAPSDSEELHLRQFYAVVGVGKDSVGKDGKEYKARNEVKKYFYPTDDQGNDLDPPIPAIDAVQPTAAAPVARAQAPANDNKAAPAARAAGSKPWVAKK